MFDLAFTSPPYFIIERYIKDESQSWVKYKKIEDWLKSFLFKTGKGLKKDGILAINISDVYCNHG